MKIDAEVLLETFRRGLDRPLYYTVVDNPDLEISGHHFIYIDAMRNLENLLWLSLRRQTDEYDIDFFIP